MTYCTVDDLVGQYGQFELVQLTGSTNAPAGSINTDKAQRAIDDASAEIDLYLHSRYQLPLSAIPAVIKRLACTLAFACLHTHSQESHPAHQRAKEARQTLNGIAKGSLSIGLSESGDSIGISDSIQFSEGRNDWAGRW